MELHCHQHRRHVADCAGPVAALAVLKSAALILAERELAWPLLDAGAVHGFDPPAAGQHDDPLRSRVLVPIADPADGLDGEHHCRVRPGLLVIPLRSGTADAMQLVVGQGALRLVADAGLVGPQVPIGDAGLRASLVGYSRLHVVWKAEPFGRVIVSLGDTQYLEGVGTMTLINEYAPPLLRFCLVVLFLFSALDKVVNRASALEQAGSGRFVPAMLAIAIVVEVAAPICIVIGWHDRLAAFVLAGFCAVTAVLYHKFWRYPDLWRFREGEGLPASGSS